MRMLFSKSGYTVGDRRRILSPEKFSSQLLLHVNAHLWNIRDVSDILHEK